MSGSAAQLVAVRHGRTEWNLEGRFQGWADPPLDEVGRRQAAKCAESLRVELGGGRVRVVCSDLARAVSTAAAIAEALEAPVARDSALREVDVGEWEGLLPSEAEQRFPAEYARWAAGEDVRRGGGETLAEAGARVADAVSSALAACDGPTLVVVGHGMSLQAALGLLRSRDVINVAGLIPHLANAEYLRVRVGASGPRPLQDRASL